MCVSNHRTPGVAAAYYVITSHHVNLSEANELAQEFGRLPDMRYNVILFQPPAAQVTCHIWDVGASIRMNTTASVLIGFVNYITSLLGRNTRCVSLNVCMQQ